MLWCINHNRILLDLCAAKAITCCHFHNNQTTIQLQYSSLRRSHSAKWSPGATYALTRRPKNHEGSQTITVSLSAQTENLLALHLQVVCDRNWWLMVVFSGAVALVLVLVAPPTCSRVDLYWVLVTGTRTKAFLNARPTSARRPNSRRAR